MHSWMDGVWWRGKPTGHPFSQALTAAVIIAMLIHKIPEGLALGAMLRVTAPRFAIPLAP
jgi:hypothetical protein